MKSGRMLTVFLPIMAVAALLLILPAAVSDTATGRVDVGNSAPAVSNVKLIDWGASDNNQIGDSMSGHQYNYRVACNFTVSDINGIGDIKVPVANISHSTSSATGSDDSDVHYSNSSCIMNYSSGTNELTFTCLFRIQYYADAGTWTCDASVYDGSSSRGTGSDTATLQSITSLEINQTTLNFGSMSAGTNSSSAQAGQMINIGNVEIDVQISGNDLTNASDTIIMENITFNRTIYTSTKYGSTSNNPNTAPRRLQSAAYEWDLNIRDRESGDANFVTANKTGQFRIIIPNGQKAALYKNTITINGVAS